jgi:hypothetical protein
MPQIDKAVIYSNFAGGYIPLPQHELTDGTMALTGKNNPMPIQIEFANGQVPMEKQSTRTDLIQPQPGVAVAPAGTNTSQFYPLTGFTDIAFTFQSSAQDTNTVDLLWSHDGVNVVNTETILTSGSRSSGWYRNKRLAEYVAVKVTNGGSSVRTMSTYIDKQQ